MQKLVSALPTTHFFLTSLIKKILFGKFLVFHPSFIAPGLDPTNKRVIKIFRIWIQFLNYGNCDLIKNSWILFPEFWQASCTKKLDPIFFRFIQKNLRVQNFQNYQKKLDLRISVGRIKPSPIIALQTSSCKFI